MAKEHYPQSPHGEQKMEWKDLPRSRSLPKNAVNFSHPVRDSPQPPSFGKLSPKKMGGRHPQISHLIFSQIFRFILLCNFIAQTFMKRKSEMMKKI